MQFFRVINDWQRKNVKNDQTARCVRLQRPTISYTDVLSLILYPSTVFKSGPTESDPAMLIPQLSSTQDAALSSALQSLIDDKTKPQGSLGVLEFIAHRIGLIQQTSSPRIDRAAIVVFAADHGVVAENISAYPQSVTWQMVENFLQQGAAINVFARQNDCALHIVDAGVNHDFGQRTGLIDRKLAGGTRNFAQEPAMSLAQCELALQHGMALVNDMDVNVIGFGEMGIGNTTAAAAIMHKLTGIALAECVGAGTGLTAQGILHKQHVIERALSHHAA